MKSISINSPDSRDGKFLLIWSQLCLLMPWRLKSPGHQQVWYWQCMIGNIIGLPHWEFGRPLLNKMQDMTENVNTSPIIFKSIQHIRVKKSAISNKNYAVFRITWLSWLRSGGNYYAAWRHTAWRLRHLLVLTKSAPSLPMRHSYHLHAITGNTRSMRII